ncbi:60S ribosomal protein L23A [Glugoides intestinalis]
MIAKKLSIKDHYNFRKIKFNDPLDFKPKQKLTLKNALCIKSETPSSFSIIKHGLKNESSAKTMEQANTLIFICDVNATKPMIKKAIEELYDSKVVKVNTLNMFKVFAKKAFVKFANEGDALEVATKAGIL